MSYRLVDSISGRYLAYNCKLATLHNDDQQILQLPLTRGKYLNVASRCGNDPDKLIGEGQMAFAA